VLRKLMRHAANASASFDVEHLMRRRFFDPEKWKIVLVDQRGCGASKPQGDLKGNTTQVPTVAVLYRIYRTGCVCPSGACQRSFSAARTPDDSVFRVVARGICSASGARL
jgi:pimeloyl-ACP methyl ester carboxylesterase